MSSIRRPYRGVFPVVPTIFDEQGGIDLPGQLRAVDFMIDAGSNGLCILANFSEQFVLSDAERELLTRAILERVAGRVPVIVTTTHYSTQICIARSQQAQELGAAMVMVMPPYHGATFKPVKISDAGRRHLGNLLSQLSDQQLRDLFESARFDHVSGLLGTRAPAPVDAWVSTFKSKVAQITDGPSCPS